MIETIAILTRNNYTFTIEKSDKGYYTLKVEKLGNIITQSSPDLGELIGRIIDKVI